MEGDCPLREAARLHDVALAEIFAGRLRAEGIEAQLFDSGFAGLLGGGQPGIRLMVPKADLAAAQARIAAPDS
ncbi:putative signal transducing protein [Thermaurantiacus sp.]